MTETVRLGLFLVLMAASFALVGRMYFGRARPDSRIWAAGLALLHAAVFVWLLAEFFFPTRESSQVIYHPPSLLLAIDRGSPWFASDFEMGRPKGNEVSKNLVRHYSGLGFKVVVREFEDTLPSGVWGRADSPHLQGVFLLSDFRSPNRCPPRPTNPGYAVFPQPPEKSGFVPESLIVREIQGSASQVEGFWRSWGEIDSTVWELRLRGKPQSTFPVTPAITDPWALQHENWEWPTRISLPRASEAGEWSAVMRRGKLEAEIPIRWSLRESEPRCIFIAPLVSLDERAALDVIRESGKCRVEVLKEEAAIQAGNSPKNSLWIRQGAGRKGFIKAAGDSSLKAAQVHYFLSEESVLSSLSADDVITASAGLAGVLSSGFLRVRDGAAHLSALRDTGFVESIQVESNNGQLTLVGLKAKTNQVSMVLPSLWDIRFRRDAPSQWVENTSSLILAGLILAQASSNPIDSSGFQWDISKSRKIGFDRELAQAWAARTTGRIVDWVEGGPQGGWPEFPQTELREERREVWNWTEDIRLYSALILGLVMLWVGRRWSRLD
jgi:hypothetical protein